MHGSFIHGNDLGHEFESHIAPIGLVFSEPDDPHATAAKDAFGLEAAEQDHVRVEPTNRLAQIKVGRRVSRGARGRGAAGGLRAHNREKVGVLRVTILYAMWR